MEYQIKTGKDLLPPSEVAPDVLGYWKRNGITPDTGVETLDAWSRELTTTWAGPGHRPIGSM